MGRYVSFGIVRTYCFFKKSIRDYVNDWFNLRLNLKDLSFATICTKKSLSAA